MKALKHILSASLALGGTVLASGQVITTLETVSTWNGSSNLSFANNGRPITQTMMLPSATPAIYSMSWRFLSANVDPVTTTSTLSAYFAEWDTALNRPTGAALWSATSLTLPSTFTQTISGSPTFNYYDLALTPNLLTDPAKTYGMILIASGLDPKLQVAINDADDGFGNDSFTYGDALRRTSGSTFSYAALTTGAASSALGGDWLFSQIILADSVLTPIPETGTVAVVFAGALVVGLGIRRRVLAKRQIPADQIAAA